MNPGQDGEETLLSTLDPVKEKEGLKLLMSKRADWTMAYRPGMEKTKEDERHEKKGLSLLPSDWTTAYRPNKCLLQCTMVYQPFDPGICT